VAKLVILFDNLSDGATFVAGYGSWLAALPLTNMQDTDIALVARSNGAASTSTRFRLDLGSERHVDGIAFGPANLSPGGTWVFSAFGDATFSSPIYTSGAQIVGGTTVDWSNPASWLEWEDPGFWLGIPSDVVVDDLPQYLFHIAPQAVSSRFFQVDITDPNNTDGFVDIGRLLIGRAFRPSINYGEDNSLSADPITDVNESLGGKRTYWERGVRRAWRASFQHLSETEIFDSVMSMALQAGISRQVFLVPDPADTVLGTRRSFLATMKTAPAVQQLLAAHGSTVIDLEEVL
jgi:hypothetical protein